MGRVGLAVALAVVVGMSSGCTTATGTFAPAVPAQLCDIIGRSALREVIPGLEVVLSRPGEKVDGAPSVRCQARALDAGALVVRLVRYGDGSREAKLRYQTVATEYAIRKPPGGQKPVSGDVSGVGDDAYRRVDQLGAGAVTRLQLVSRQGHDVVDVEFTADRADQLLVERGADEIARRVFAAL